MSKVIFKKGLFANLPSSAEENVLLFATDVGRLFQGTGIGKDLIEYSNLITGYSDLTELKTENPSIENKLYVTDDGNIYIYLNNDYVSLGGGGVSDWNSIKGKPLKVTTGVEKIEAGIKVHYDDATSEELVLESARSNAVVLCDREW